MKKFFLPLFLSACLHSQSQTLFDFDDAKRVAKFTNKLILIDFNATWCGPCKQMDVDFWDNDKYKNLKDKFVIAKIDVDQYKSFAISYNVSAIPNIKVVDIAGNELMTLEGYMNGEMMQKSLGDFPSSTGELYQAMEFENKDKPNAEECLYVAAGYQNIAQTTTGTPKNAFISLSNDYFLKCKKNHPTDSIAQKADIGRAFNYVLDKAPKKAIKEINIEKTYEENKPFALYILARAYAEMNDKTNAEKYIAMLESLHQEYWSNAAAAIRKKLEK